MSVSLLEEKIFLESVVPTYTTGSSQDRLIKSLAMRIFKPFFELGKQNKCALEFGCCDGYMSSVIASLCQNLTIVDGSRQFIDMASKKVTENVKFVHALFEEYTTDKKFDYIFATYVLEHVLDPIQFLKQASGFLSENGLLFIVVPNARAMSRQIARHMGLIDDLFSLTQNDVNHGHRRVYDRILLNKDIDEAGLLQISQGGILLKLLSDFQMDKMLDMDIIGPSQIEGLYKMGLEYPDFAGSLFSVCKRSK
ncbi:MAG: class I SAM-dependent methyltransferase [Gammaproteobacteria bacterium]|nr:class I SAM-dependent methyltransferase [Gammaproteobacteria bacterium]